MQFQGNQSSPVAQNGYLFAELISPLTSVGSPAPGHTTGAFPANMENVGFMTANRAAIYGKNDTLTAIIHIKTLNILPVGSRGWGFWHSEWVPVTINQAVWFMQQTASPDSSWGASETWWRARVHRTVAPTYSFFTNLDGAGGSPYNYDNQQWHSYKVVRHARDYYRMYVDGVQVINKIPFDFPDSSIMNADYSFNCWNDNFVYHSTTNALSGNDTVEVYGNTWSGASRWVLDYVEIIRGNYQYGYSRTPVGPIALREVVNEIDDGITDGNFKGPYSFNAVAGKTVIIASGKAEELDSYAPDDDMKMILDSKDFGYNTTRSWNGLSDAGALKTILIDTSLSSGNHTLEFQSIFTPILYDATVLSSANGSVVLNQTINASASSGSNNTLWQTLNFTANAGEVVIYLSGSADEEPGWDHKNANIDSTDDDELRLELDGYDFGWGTDSASFVGNTLFGDNKTICIRKTVSNGSHTLKLYANQTPYVHKVIVYAENGDQSLSVSLTSFSAAREKAGALIRWQVAAELENAGFNLYRADVAVGQTVSDQAYLKLNDRLIPGRGNAASAKEYRFTDAKPLPVNKETWYRLEDVAYDGSVEKYGPVRLKVNILPEHFSVGQNYPNPFNPSTNIPFSLKQAGRVTAYIYDIRGRRVRTLVSHNFPSGNHILVWDGLDNNYAQMPSGIYYYRIATDRGRKIRKMTLIR